MNETLQTIFNRKSVRHFTAQPVSESDIDLIVRAGMAAPSACNAQPWQFIVVDDRQLLDKLAETLPYAKMQREAPIGLVVCADLQKTLPPPHADLWSQDCAAATQNILLAVESLGLGAVWTCVHGLDNNIRIIKETLDLPESIVPFSFIPIGHPSTETKPKNKYNPERIHRNHISHT